MRLNHLSTVKARACRLGVVAGLVPATPNFKARSPDSNLDSGWRMT
jgi:hypothetical protein